MQSIRAYTRHFVGILVVLSAGLIFSACTSQNKAGLQVLSGDTPSSVYLDGKLMDVTPYINKELKPAEYSLEIRPEDTSFVPYQTKISLKKGMLTVVNWKPGKRPETSGGVIFETEPLPDKKATELLITTIPDGGIIYVDGEAKGFAPVTVQNLSRGEHQFEVKLPSYGSQSHPINILEGYRIIVTAKLGKQDYQLEPNLETTATSSAQPSTATASASPTASVRPSPSPTTAAQTSAVVPPKVTVQKTGFIQSGQEVLRVRNQPSAAGTEIGFAPVGSEYTYLKETKDGWVKIQFGQEIGWVSQQFVVITDTP